MDLPGGSYMVKDRAYIDYKHLFSLTKLHINFVVRAKRDITCKVLYSNTPDTDAGILKEPDSNQLKMF